MTTATKPTYEALEARLALQRKRWEDLFGWLATAAYACEVTAEENELATSLTLNVEQYAAAEAMREVREQMRQMDPTLPRRQSRTRGRKGKRGNRR